MALDANDLTQINTIISDALAGAGESFATQARTAATETITAQIGTLTTGLKAVEDKVAAIPAAGGVKPEDLSKAVSDQVQSVLAQQAKDRQTAETQAAADKAIADKREAYIAKHGAKLPKTYHHLIPKTADEAELATAVATATAALTEDMKSVGATLPSLGAAAGAAADGNAAAADQAANRGKNPVAGLVEAYKTQQQ